jgi:DNA polymerase
VNRVLGLIEQETEYIDAQTELMSMGAIRSATQRVPVMNWLENLGVFLPNLQKKTVEDALATDLAGETNEYTKREDAEQAKRLLQYRLDISKSSTKKYTAFEERSRTDSRLRDILIYHTASTGRWGGAGVQPQNFPRGSIKDSIQASRLVMREDLEMIRMIYGSPMAVFSSIIRNMIVAPKGQTLDVADYAAIEARVLFWVANHEEGLQAFREDRDLYKEQAMDIYRIKDIDLIDSTKRFLGKSAILGAGYAMGAKKFQATCAQQGEVVSLELADTAIKSYRKKHWPVVKLWGNIEKAAISAVQRPGKKITVNHTSWFLSKDNFLFCELPSGRRIAYATPTVKFEPTPWGEKRPVLYHWGVDPTTKQWVEAKTYGGKLVENVVQAIARDLMAEAMLRIDAVGWSRIVLTVHDELVAERTLFGEGSNEEFCRLMAETPEWAKGLPVKVEGFESARYRK